MKTAAQKIELEYNITFDRVVIKAPKFDREIFVERVDDGKFAGQFEIYVSGGSYGFKKSFAAAVSFAEKQIKSSIINNDLEP